MAPKYIWCLITACCILHPQVAKSDTILSVLEDLGATKLISLVEKAGLVDQLRGSNNELFLPFSTPLTLFAPTNEAFENIPREVFNQLDSDPELLKNVLLGHVIPKTPIFYRNGDLRNDQVYESAALNGTYLRVNVYLKNKFYDGYMTVNGKRVSKADVPAEEEEDLSVIHVVTEVLYPLVKKNNTIAQVLLNERRFTTLVSALRNAGLLNTLEQDGPFTLFAPTNDAFENLGNRELNNLLDSSNRDDLTKTLKRHVIGEGPTLFKRGIKWSEHRTLSGEQIQTQVFKEGVFRVVNGERRKAQIEEGDLVASNGVVHAIDNVL